MHAFFKHSAYQFASPEEHSETFTRLKKTLEAHTVGLANRFQGAKIIQLAIFSLEEDALVGGLEYTMREGDRVIALQLWIASAFRERGHAERIGKAFIESTFNQGCHRLECAHRAEDFAAARLVQKLGFLPEGIQRSACRIENTWVDLAHHGLLSLDPR